MHNNRNGYYNYDTYENNERRKCHFKQTRGRFNFAGAVFFLEAVLTEAVLTGSRVENEDSQRTVAAFCAAACRSSASRR